MLMNGGVILMAMAASMVNAAAPGKPAALRCEYLVNPLAVDVAAPRLSWELDDPERGAVQSAWQVQVASSTEMLADDRADLWDSGKVARADTVHVAYAGAPLKAMQRCHWRVRVWNGRDEASPWSDAAFWGAGLGQGDWPGVWISEATPPPSDNRPHNGFHSDLSSSGDTVKWAVIDLGAPKTFDRVVLYPARPYDWIEEAPGFLFPLRYRIEVSDTDDFASPVTVADLTAADVPNPAMERQAHRFEPQTARYVRLMVTRLRERDPGNFGFALAEMTVQSGEENLALGAAVTASDAIEHNSWSRDRLTDGEILPHPGGQSDTQPAAQMRAEFTLDAPVRRATAYATALGVYELCLNGERVGDLELAPEWTDYRDRVQYQAYDVTGLLREGANAAGVILGDGWCVGRIGMAQMIAGKARRVYRDKPAFMMRLHVEFEDGTTRDIVTDGSWSATLDGPVRASDMLDGEHYDARMEVDGWDFPGFGAQWPAVVMSEPYDGLLVAQPSEPLRVLEELAAVALTEPQPGVHVFDLGQNMVGHVRLRLRGEAGTIVTLRHAEMLNDDGTVYVQNLRGAAQTDRYILRGSPEGETFEPRFTYHGFRYVEVTGLAQAPGIDDITGRVVWSGAAQTGSFTSSDPLLNRLWQNILWTQRANLFSVPTDCPQRDERLGWQGDIQAFAQTGVFNMDLAASLAKFALDQRDAQTADGRFSDIAPNIAPDNIPFTGAPAWGDAGVMVPWTAYVNYGDTRLIEEHYEAARRWVDYIHGKNPGLLWLTDRGNDYNDWLNSDTFENLDLPKTGGEIPKEVFATAFFARSTHLVSEMARVIGKADDAAQYAALAGDIRKAFAEAYVDAEGRIQGDTQAGYALALNFGLLPESMRPAAIGHLKAAFERFGGRFSTGIQTTHRLMLELARSGHMEDAYALAAQRDIPSWGFMIDQGATTIWERWDGYVPGRGFQNPGMNSFNHWAFGAVGEWMHACILGLEPDPDQPGYRHFFVHPRPGGGLTHAAGTYRSIRGEISIAWRDTADAFELDLTVPPNTTSTVTLPAGKDAAEGGKPLSGADGISNVREADGNTVFTAAAGSYHFRVAKGG
jgi:alpha-L-rhamnosidase